MFKIMAAWTENGKLASVAVRPTHQLACQPFRQLEQAIWWAKYLATMKPEWAYVVVNKQGKIVWDSIAQRSSLGVKNYPQTWQNRLANVLFFRRGLAKLLVWINPTYQYRPTKTSTKPDNRPVL